MKRRTLLLLPAAAAAAPPPVDALFFDVFGTVVDWRGSIIREGEQFTRRTGRKADWGRFADRWRAGYDPAMDKVRKGTWPWMRIDDLHRRILDDQLRDFNLQDLSEAQRREWNRIWHRLTPWPDSVAGLERLRKRYTLATLSNGNVSLLVEMAKRARLPWDAVLSAELFQHYKPDPEVYLEAAKLLDVPPQRAMMVASHRGDLVAARQCGFRTAFVHRPLEHGPHGKRETPEGESFDLVARDFVDLAAQLSA